MGTISDKLVDQHRYINVEHEWWDSTYDYWTERLERMGVSDIDIRFSGFYSQGDGASFTGTIRYSDMAKFMRIHGLRDKYRPIYEMAKRHEWHGLVSRQWGNYAHENTVCFESHNDGCEHDDPDDLRDIMYNAQYHQADAMHSDFDKEVQEILRGYMQEIYSELEDEYDYLTSDECVRETLEASEIYDDEDELLEAA